MKRYFFRPHRGGLKQAMVEHKFFDTIHEMLNYVLRDYNSCAISKISYEDITFKLYDSSPDERIGWNYTFIILIKGSGFAFFTDSYHENWDKYYFCYCRNK